MSSFFEGLFFKDPDLRPSATRTQLYQVKSCSQEGELKLDFPVGGLVELFVNALALQVVYAHLGGATVFAGKPKSDGFREGIGEGDDIKGKHNLFGKGWEAPEKSLTHIKGGGGEGSGNATLPNGLLHAKARGEAEGLGSHGADGLVAQGLAIAIVNPCAAKEKGNKQGVEEELHRNH